MAEERGVGPQRDVLRSGVFYKEGEPRNWSGGFHLAILVFPCQNEDRHFAFLFLERASQVGAWGKGGPKICTGVHCFWKCEKGLGKGHLSIPTPPGLLLLFLGAGGKGLHSSVIVHVRQAIIVFLERVSMYVNYNPVFRT